MNCDPTVMLPLRRMWDRVQTTSDESDVAYFFDLLNLGELLTKLAVASLVASIDNREGSRYKLEYALLRANSLGDWEAKMAEALSGPSSNFMLQEARPLAQQITQKWTKNDRVWQRDAVELLDSISREIDSDPPELTSSVSLRWWFSTFVWLRNRTRGHGSPLPGTSAQVVERLAQSLHEITNGLTVLTAPCAVIRRSLSGKFRVVSLTTLDDNFERLKREKGHHYENGIYYSFGDLCFTPLLSADIDLSDLFVANGSFNAATESVTYEALSYVSDTRKQIDGRQYLNVVPQLPASETHGYPNLDVFGETFANLPPRASEYVMRSTLEDQLRIVLTDDRHPVVSLVGRGGIGKTSLALKVLHELCNTGTYEFILWFSARDIDLLSEGPKPVKPQVFTFRDISSDFVRLVEPSGADQDDSHPEEYLARALSCNTALGPILLVVDNFETVRNPAEIYHTIDTHIRLPNKVLITSRHREFKADYPVEVTGMSRSEFDELVDMLSTRLGISPILTQDYLDELFQESDGHPYVIKVMLGEIAVDRRLGNVRRVVATKEQMLDALFDRSYTTLSPGSQQVFLTLCNWRSMVTQLELEAALMRPNREYLDASEAIESLKLHSMIDEVTTPTDVPFLRVPEAARIFGKKKLGVSHMKPTVDVDTEMLQAFGTVRSGDTMKGLAPRVDQFARNIATRAANGESVSDHIDMLEYIATGYPRAWLAISDILLENPELGDATTALDAVERYLQEAPEDADAWRCLAAASRVIEQPDREMNALYRLANLPAAPFEDISNAAGALSRHLAKGQMNVGRDEKRLMATQLAKLMEARIGNANGTDTSRLAWLYLHLSREADARLCVHRGLEIEPSNRHLIGLTNRLGDTP